MSNLSARKVVVTRTGSPIAGKYFDFDSETEITEYIHALTDCLDEDAHKGEVMLVEQDNLRYTLVPLREIERVVVETRDADQL